jgi:DNA end-binding protein Ku
MAAPTPNAVLTWGIIPIPIKIYPAARNAGTELVNLHRTCAEKAAEAALGMFKRCKGCLTEVPNEQIIKAWKKSDGTYLLFTPEEIASLQAERSKGMTINGFVDFAAIDPLWLGPSNFIGPVDKSTLRPFLLLYESMKQENLAAIVSYYGHGRDKRGIIRAADDETLILFDSFFPAELRTYADQAKVELTKTQFNDQERQLGKQLIDGLRCDFTQMWMQDMPGDTFLDRVEKLKDARDKGLPMPEGLPLTPQINEGADLMALLQGSVASLKTKRQINVDTVTPSKPPAKAGPIKTVEKARKKA